MWKITKKGNALYVHKDGEYYIYYNYDQALKKFLQLNGELS